MSKAVIKNGRYTIEPLYQWDKNQVLQIYGLSLSRVPEVHFSNTALESALVRQGTMDNKGVITVDIPNSLLQRPYPIKAHVCIYEGKTFESLYTIDIPVKPRKMPADYTLENDEELYSFNNLNNRLTQVETELGLDEQESFYKYEYKSDSLVESTVSTTRRLYIPIISSSLRAIKSFLDKIVTTLTTVGTTADNALKIANARSQTYTFNTTDDMIAWISDENNAGICQVGDSLNIVDSTSPNMWVSEVLDTVDLDTRYFYKILPQETNEVTLWTNPDPSVAFPATTIDMDLSAFKSFKVIYSSAYGYCEQVISMKDNAYMLVGHGGEGFNFRQITISDTSIVINDTDVPYNSASETRNKKIVPIQIIGYRG